MMTHYNQVASLLNQGAVGLLPTDTIYGISCVATYKDAVERIYQLKGRHKNKPVIILLANILQAKQIGINSKDLELANQYWPAPLTLVVSVGKNTPKFLHRGSKTLAIRIPDAPELQKILRQTGPIVSTSANPQGLQPATNIIEAKEYFGNKLDFYVDVGERNVLPSTLAKIINGRLKVLREGAYAVSK